MPTSVPFTPTASHAVDLLLTETAAGIPTSQQLIAPLIAPVNLDSRDERSGKYPILGHEALQSVAKPVGDFDSFPKMSRSFALDEYSCVNQGISEEIPLSVRKAASKGRIQAHLATDRALARCKQVVELGWEIEVASLLVTSANYASGNYENLDTVANRNFDDTSGPGPLRIVKEFIDGSEALSNQRVDTLVVAPDTWRYLSTMTNMFGGGSLAVRLTLQDAADIFEVDRVLVARTLKASAGQTAAAGYGLSRVWESNSMIGLVTKDTGEGAPSVWTFLYDHMEGYQNGMGAFSWDTQDPWVEHVAFAMSRDVKLGGVNLSGALLNAFYLQNCLAAI